MSDNEKNIVDKNNINFNESSLNNTSKITTKDLIYLYLREIDILQESLTTLEKRIAADLLRIETDMRQHCVTNEDNFKELRDNYKCVSDEISSIKDLISKIKDTIHALELDKTTCDITQDNRLNGLEYKITVYSIIGGVASFLGINGVIQLIDWLRLLLS